jgi:Smg protein
MMKQNVVDVLVYLFQNYISDEAEVQGDRQSVQNELVEVGFPGAEVDKALAWLEDLSVQPVSVNDLEARANTSVRVFAPEECRKLDSEARNFLMELERTGIIDSEGRELIMDRVMALETEQIDVEELRWVILMVLFNQPGLEEAYAWMEDLVFDGSGVYLH